MTEIAPQAQNLDRSDAIEIADQFRKMALLNRTIIYEQDFDVIRPL